MHRKYSPKPNVVLNVVLILIILLSTFAQGNKVSASSFKCWNCDKYSERAYTKNCPECGWDICPYCGACSYNCDKGRNDGPNLLVIVYVFLAGVGVIGFIYEKFGGYTRNSNNDNKTYTGADNNSNHVVKNGIDLNKNDSTEYHNRICDKEEKTIKSSSSKKETLDLFQIKCENTEDKKIVSDVKDQIVSSATNKELMDMFQKISDNTILYHKTLGKLVIKEITVNNIIAVNTKGERKVLLNNKRIVNNLYDIKL